MIGEVLQIWEDKNQVKIAFEGGESWFEIVAPANIKYAKLGKCEFSINPTTAQDKVPKCIYLKSNESAAKAPFKPFPSEFKKPYSKEYKPYVPQKRAKRFLKVYRDITIEQFEEEINKFTLTHETTATQFQHKTSTDLYDFFVWYEDAS